MKLYRLCAFLFLIVSKTQPTYANEDETKIRETIKLFNPANEENQNLALLASIQNIMSRGDARPSELIAVRDALIKIATDKSAPSYRFESTNILIKHWGLHTLDSLTLLHPSEPNEDIRLAALEWAAWNMPNGPIDYVGGEAYTEWKKTKGNRKSASAFASSVLGLPMTEQAWIEGITKIAREGREDARVFSAWVLGDIYGRALLFRHTIPRAQRLASQIAAAKADWSQGSDLQKRFDSAAHAIIELYSNTCNITWDGMRFLGKI